MSKQFPHPFGDLAAKYRAYRKKLPAVASAIAVSQFKNNFKAQGLVVAPGKVEKWAPRKGIQKGASRAILIKSGRLRRSMRPSPTYQYARVVSSAPYAAIHNQGGRIRGYARSYASNLRSKKTKLRTNSPVGGIGGSPAIMPARPFMRTTPMLLDAITKYNTEQLGQLFNSARSQ